SSFSSWSTCLRRNRERKRKGTVYSQCSGRISGFLQLDDLGDSRREPVPVGSFFFQLAAAQPGQRIEFGATIVLTGPPLGRDPSFLLQLVECRVQRSVADLQYFAGHLLQPLADGPAVKRLQGQNLQNQQVQRALHQIGRFAHWSLPRLPRLD